MCRQHSLGAGGGERRPAGQHLVGDDTYGIQIGAVIDVRIGRGLFRSHVGRRAQRHPQRSKIAAPRLGHRLGDTEVGDQGVIA